MAHGTIVAIAICPAAGMPMKSVDSVVAIAGRGLSGDRYAYGEGSYNKGNAGRRQVTLANDIFIEGSGFRFLDTRRNISVRGVELMDQIGHEFFVGDVRMRGLKYCDSCMRPGKIIGSAVSFRESFWDRGGLIAEILESGVIGVGGIVTPREKNY